MSEFLITERSDGKSRQVFTVAVGVRGLVPGTVMAATEAPDTVVPYSPGLVAVGVFYRWAESLPGDRVAVLIVRDAEVWQPKLKRIDAVAADRLAKNRVLVR